MPKYIIVTLALLLIAGAHLHAHWSIYTEAGAALTAYNDVQIPNDSTHDRFSLSSDLSAKAALSGRINIFYEINAKHRLALLYSPLTIKSSGSFDRDIRYRGETFEANQPIDALYRFDSYRLQYSYHFASKRAPLRYVGASLKLRDAEIKLSTPEKTTTKSNTGLVPLLSLGLGYDINDQYNVTLDAEGLGSPFGRALDAIAAVNVKYSEKLQFRIGYRVLEGGSDGDEVYTFALIHYPVAGMFYRF